MHGLFAIALTFALRKDVPYPGSVYEPVEQRPAPLLVVLHGDNQSASAMRDALSVAASKRSIAVLYLQCPKQLGCKGSFWQWNGEPKFIDDAVDSIKDDIDPERVWIAGWSGGASYLGLRAFELSDKYAAVAFAGGGIPPSGACPTRVLPAYFLVGDKNPLHHLAVGLRDGLQRCDGEVVWDLRKGADHPAEWKALAKDADRVLAWFEQHPRPKKVVAIEDAGVDSAPPPSPPPLATSSPTPSSPPPPPVRCACDVVGGPSSSGLSLWLVAAALLRRTKQRARCGGRVGLDVVFAPPE